MFNKLVKKLEENLEATPKTKQGTPISVLGTGQSGQFLWEALTDGVFEKGRSQGKKDGYVEASCEYEEKLLKQAEIFLKQTKDFKTQKKEYEQLINEYEKYIDAMSERNDLSDEEEDCLKRIMIMERKLKNAKNKKQ